MCRRRILAEYLDGETRLECMVTEALCDVCSAEVVEYPAEEKKEVPGSLPRVRRHLPGNEEGVDTRGVVEEHQARVIMCQYIQCNYVQEAGVAAGAEVAGRVATVDERRRRRRGGRPRRRPTLRRRHSPFQVARYQNLPAVNDGLRLTQALEAIANGMQEIRNEMREIEPRLERLETRLVDKAGRP